MGVFALVTLHTWMKTLNNLEEYIKSLSRKIRTSHTNDISVIVFIKMSLPVEDNKSQCNIGRKSNGNHHHPPHSLILNVGRGGRGITFHGLCFENASAWSLNVSRTLKILIFRT